MKLVRSQMEKCSSLKEKKDKVHMFQLQFLKINFWECWSFPELNHTKGHDSCTMGCWMRGQIMVHVCEWLLLISYHIYWTALLKLVSKWVSSLHKATTQWTRPGLEPANCESQFRCLPIASPHFYDVKHSVNLRIFCPLIFGHLNGSQLSLLLCTRRWHVFWFPYLLVRGLWLVLSYSGRCSAVSHLRCLLIILSMTTMFSSAILSHGRASPCDWFWSSKTTVISFNSGTDHPTDIVQLHWRPLLSCCCCAHLEQSSAICNCVRVSADFLEEIENWTVSEIVYDCQSSVTQYYVTWPWSFLYLCHDNGNSFVH